MTERLCCAWCGRYLSHDTKMTCWRVRARQVRQQENDPWNYYGRHLCPGCSRAASIRTPWWEPVTVSQVTQHVPELFRPGPTPRRQDEIPLVDDRFAEPTAMYDPEQESPPRPRDSVLYLMSQTPKDTTP